MTTLISRFKLNRLSLRHCTIIAVLAGLIWRTARFLANWPLWGDEAFIAVSLMTRDFFGLTQPLEYYQIAPPGFLWSELVVIKLLGASERALRLLPFLCGVASLLLFWKFAAKLLDRRAAFMAVALFAASFYPIRHANEVKPYAGDLLLAQAVTMLGWAIVSRKPGRPWLWVTLTVISCAGVWMSYPLIFVSSGIGLFLAWHGRKNRHELVASLIFLVCTCISWAVMYMLIAKPQAEAAPFLTQMPTWENSFPPVTRPWLLPWWLIVTHTGNMMAYPYGGNNFGSVATTILVAFGIVSLWKRERRLLIYLMMPIIPALAAAAVHRYPYGTSARIAMFLAPAICLLAGAGISRLVIRLAIPRFRQVNYRVIAAGFVVAAIAGAIFSVAVPYKDIDDLELREVVSTVAAKTKPGDRWVGFNGLRTLPRDDAIMLMPWLQHTAQLRYYVLRDCPVDYDWNPDVETYNPSKSSDTWFIMHNSGFDKFPFADLEKLNKRLSVLNPPEGTRIVIRPLEFVDVFRYPAGR